MQTLASRRILVGDDMPSSAPARAGRYRIDSADQGREALALVQAAAKKMPRP